MPNQPIIYVNTVKELQNKVSLFRRLYDYDGELRIYMVRGQVITKESDKRGEYIEVRDSFIYYNRTNYYLEKIEPRNKITGFADECDVEFSMVDEY